MTKFVYNNMKNASTGYIIFELNCNHHLYSFYEKDINPYSQSKSIKEIANKFRDLIIIYKENLYYTQELQK